MNQAAKEDKMNRTLAAKAIRFRSRAKDFQPPDLATLMARVFEVATTAADRHHPPLGKDEKIEVGTQCSFINRKVIADNYCLFHVWTYSRGEVPETMEADLNKPEVSSKSVDLSVDGQAREVVSACRCLAYGEVLLIEQVKGTGGAAVVRKLITSLLRRYIEPKHPVLHLDDFASQSFNDLVKQKGGIIKVAVRLAHTPAEETSVYAQNLTEVRGSVRGARSVQVTWAAEDASIDAQDAAELMDELDSDQLDSVIVTFKDKSSIQNLSSYRERREISVARERASQPNVLEIEKALLDYLADLRDPRKGGPVGSDGRLVDVRFIEAGG